MMQRCGTTAEQFASNNYDLGCEGTRQVEKIFNCTNNRSEVRFQGFPSIIEVFRSYSSEEIN